MIAIEAIKFNHHPSAAANDALNIRVNASRFVSVPEWRRFICVNAEDSRVAYAIAPTQRTPITIEVALSSTDPGVAFVEVRVEGRVKPRPISFINGKCDFVSFELIHPPVSHGQVGIWDIAWHWEYRVSPHQPWHHFATTRHRMYVLLDIPAAPWQQSPYNPGNTQLPWTDVLDYAAIPHLEPGTGTQSPEIDLHEG